MIKKNHVAEASYHFANANYHFTGKELLTQIEKSLFCVGIFLPRQKKCECEGCQYIIPPKYIITSLVNILATHNMTTPKSLMNAYSLSCGDIF